MTVKKVNSNLKHCNTCGLPESFPGIHFNNECICNFCINFQGLEYENNKREEYSQKFESMVKEYKGKSTYDALMCYSGGKDSTYTLIVLREKYNLKVLIR